MTGFVFHVTGLEAAILSQSFIILSLGTTMDRRIRWVSLSFSLLCAAASISLALSTVFTTVRTTTQAAIPGHLRGGSDRTMEGRCARDNERHCGVHQFWNWHLHALSEGPMRDPRPTNTSLSAMLVDVECQKAGGNYGFGPSSFVGHIFTSSHLRLFYAKDS